MEEMTLAKALKYKNRLIEQIRRVEKDVEAHNSILCGARRPIEVRPLWRERRILVDALVELKVNIALANAPIRGSIFRLSELKNEIRFCRELDVREGLRQVNEDWGRATSATLEYEVALNKATVDARIDEILSEMDTIQDRLDEHNHGTSVFVAEEE